MTRSRSRTLAELIRESFDGLTRAERQLANLILENYPVSGMGSITAIAKASGVSSPTVARMARKLGFSGFPAMQAALKDELKATISNPIVKHDQLAEGAPDTHILNQFADAVLENMRQSLKRIDPALFDNVVALLSDSGRAVHVTGGRITHTIARYFFTHMQVIRSGLNLIDSGSNTWPHYVLNMNDGDILVVFDIRRYEHNLIRLAEMANGRGVTIILFTDQWGSPVAKHAQHTFNLRIEVPSAWDSSVTTLFMVEALLAAIQTNTWDETRGRMKTLEELFDKTKLFRKFS
jgi:DNA-binding MurR/RpiR family transcriptional regulator